MIKTSQSEVQERIRNYNPQGKRRVGMPNVRWTDIINNDLRKPCGDKRGWRRIVEEAKTFFFVVVAEGGIQSAECVICKSQDIGTP